MRGVTSFVILAGASAFAVCAAQAPVTSSGGASTPSAGAAASAPAPIPSAPAQTTKPAALQSTSAAPQIAISKPQITFAAPRAARAMASATHQQQVTVRSSKPEYPKGPWHEVIRGQDYYCRLKTTGSHVERTPVCLTRRQLEAEHVQTQQFFENFYRTGAGEQAVTKTTMSNNGGAIAGAP